MLKKKSELVKKTIEKIVEKINELTYTYEKTKDKLDKNQKEDLIRELSNNENELVKLSNRENSEEVAVNYLNIIDDIKKIS